MKRLLLAAAATLVSLPALAGDLMVKDAYARTSNQKVGAAFMHIMNASDTADRLIEARSDAARKIELHTHVFEDGVARMVELEGGIEIPAQGMTKLERGGLHVMFIGIQEEWSQGDAVPVTLVFESGAEIALDIAVDNERQDAHGGHGHGGHGSGHGGHGGAQGTVTN
ncbi:MAG: copper chaperone PCu(A)C [Pseudomonadota bacterium]